MREYFAEILMMEIEEFISLENKRILDVGGARGTFCRMLSKKKACEAINLEPNPDKHSVGGPLWPKTIIGYAENLPFENNEYDLVICRGVLEHIPPKKQQQSVDEMYRVTKPGGLCYIMIPPWYNPHAGHRLKPFHLLPFKWAKFLRQLIFREKIEANSLAEAGLYPITFRKMARMICSSGFDVIATKDVHFRLHFLTKIPLVQEVMVPAVAFICKKTAQNLKG